MRVTDRLKHYIASKMMFFQSIMLNGTLLFISDYSFFFYASFQYLVDQYNPAINIRGSEWGSVFIFKLANFLMFTVSGENTVKCLEGLSRKPLGF